MCVPCRITQVWALVVALLIFPLQVEVLCYVHKSLRVHHNIMGEKPCVFKEASSISISLLM
jgi:hypothetical protein